MKQNYAHAAKKEKPRHKLIERVKKAVTALRNKLRASMMKLFPGYKYAEICRACGLKNIDWQRKYALGKATMPSGLRFFRHSGKTTAVILKLLMLNAEDIKLKCSDILNILADDPDFHIENPGHINAGLKIYTAQALWAGIKVPRLDLTKIAQAFKEVWD